MTPSRRRRLVAAVVLLVLAAALVWLRFGRRGGDGDGDRPRDPAAAGHRLAADRRGAAPPVTPAAAAVPDRATVTDVDAPGGVLAGRVVNWSTGDGVVGAELSFAGDDDTVETVRSTDDGRFRFTPPGPGGYVLAAATAPGFLPYAPEWRHSTVAVTGRAGRAVDGLTVYLFPAIDYQGLVVDARGAPVAGARVRMIGSPAGEQALETLGSEWTSDAGGRFTFHAPDDAVLEAVHPTRGHGRARLGEAEALTHRMTIRLAPGRPVVRTLRGTVVDGDGHGLAEVLVRADPVAAPGAEPRTRAERGPPRGPGFTLTDETGQFVLAGLDDGHYDVTAEAEGQAPAVARAVAAGGPPITLVVDGGQTVSGRVRTGAGDPVPAYTLVAWRRDGARRDLVGSRIVADALGRFAIRVPPGDYELIASPPGWAPSPPTQVRAGDDDVELVVSAGAVLRGRVVSAGDGAPLARARVNREARGGGASAQPANPGTVTRDDGSFELTGIPAGPLSIMVLAFGHHPRIEAGMVAADGQSLGPITVTLTPLREGEQPALELVGIGVELRADDAGLRVGRVFAGGGAAAAGIVAGDVITAVGGTGVAELGLPGAIARIRGVPGSTVRLHVVHDPADPGRDLDVERRPLTSPPP